MDKRLAAAESILKRGVRFLLPAPFFSRLLRLNRITIYPLFPGTIFEFSTVVLKHKLEDAMSLRDYAALAKSIKPVARCVAIAILNDEKAIAEKVDKLQRKLLWKVPPELLLKMFIAIARMNRKEDFMNITRYFVIQTSMMLNPNLGQEENGE